MIHPKPITHPPISTIHNSNHPPTHPSHPPSTITHPPYPLTHPPYPFTHFIHPPTSSTHPLHPPTHSIHPTTHFIHPPTSSTHPLHPPNHPLHPLTHPHRSYGLDCLEHLYGSAEVREIRQSSGEWVCMVCEAPRRVCLVEGRQDWREALHSMFIPSPTLV